MGKKEKTKLKSKSGGGTDGHARYGGDANNEEFGEDAGAAAIAGWGPQSNTGDRIDGFGAGGWGESPVEEEQPLTWHPEPGGGTWDAPAPDMGTLPYRYSYLYSPIKIVIFRSMDGRGRGRNPRFIRIRT
jgi:hypothetical protein